MTSTPIFDRGDVVVVSVPFTGQDGARNRPALVVSVKTFHRKLRDLILCPISSRPVFYEKPGRGDHPLRHWSQAGLRHPSTARVSNLLAVEKQVIRRAIGRVHEEDLAAVMANLRDALGL